MTDNGLPPNSDARSFTVTVLPRPGIQAVTGSSTNATLTWSAIPGTTYRVQFKTDLNDTNWTALLPDVTATGSTASLTDPPAATQRFYRILVVD